MAGTGSIVRRKIGMSFMFKPDDFTNPAGSVTPWPWFDAGNLTSRTMKSDGGEDVGYDDRDGVQVPFTTDQTKYEPTWDLTTENTNAYMMALYHRSGPPIAYTQSGATATDIPHKAWQNSPIKILDASGVGVVMVTSITNVKVGGSTAVLGVDYAFNPGDLDRGFIYVLPTSTLVTAANTAITITYVLAAVTAGLEIQPLSGPCTAQGIGEVHPGACNGAFRGVERARYSIIFPSMNWPVDKVADVQLTVRKLTDFGSIYPHGRVLLTKNAQ